MAQLDTKERDNLVLRLQVVTYDMRQLTSEIVQSLSTHSPVSMDMELYNNIGILKSAIDGTLSIDVLATKAVESNHESED